MECPSCKAANPDGALECSSCQIIFSKWKAKQDRAAVPEPLSREAPAAPAGGKQAGSALKLVGYALTAIIMIVWVWSVNRAMNRSREAKKRLKEIQNEHVQRERAHEMAREATRLNPDAMTGAIRRAGQAAAVQNESISRTVQQVQVETMAREAARGGR